MERIVDPHGRESGQTEFQMERQIAAVGSSGES